MAGYNIKGDVLAQGVNAYVFADLIDDSGSGAVLIGFVDNWSIRKTMNTQEARVVGEILPVSIDVTGIQTQVTLSGFVPSKNLVTSGIAVRGAGGEVDGERLSLASFNPTDESFINGNVITKIAYLDVRDKRYGDAILACVRWLTPQTYSLQGNAQGYTKADLTLAGIGMDNGADYHQLL